MMKKINRAIALFLVTLLPAVAMAIPAQQIDITSDSGDVSYGGEDDIIVSGSTEFTVWAIASLNGHGQGGQLDEDEIVGDDALDFFLAVALVGVEYGDGSAPDIGTIWINGVAYTGADFVWGTPPPDTVSNGDDLAGHGIYNPDGAWYLEIAYDYSESEACGTFNSQDDPGTGDSADSSVGSFVEGGSSWCQSFDVDISGLSSGVNLHFDTYTILTSCTVDSLEVETCTNEINTFAPFSHDASTQVPEPGTLSLLGLGLLALGLRGRRRRLAI